MNKRESILLVGSRNGATKAARQCGWNPVVFDIHSRTEQTADAFGGDVNWALQHADELFPHRPPIGVAAVTAGSAVAAAAIRSHFGLTGISRETALRCHDKLEMKNAISTAGIPCARWMETRADSTTDELIDVLGLPIVLKMPISSGGRGMWVCKNVAELADCLRPRLLAESFVPGIEMSIETFRANGATLFRNPTRYLEPGWASVVPANLNSEDQAQIDALSEKVHSALDISCGISHMELFLTESGPIFGEIAARPPGGYLMELIAKAYAFDPWEALLRITANQTPDLPAKAEQFAGAWIIYPDPGKVAHISGIETARSLPGVVDVLCSVKQGDILQKRIGTGESKGRILSVASTHQGCVDSLVEGAGCVRITME